MTFMRRRLVVPIDGRLVAMPVADDQRPEPVEVTHRLVDELGVEDARELARQLLTLWDPEAVLVATQTAPFDGSDIPEA